MMGEHSNSGNGKNNNRLMHIVLLGGRRFSAKLGVSESFNRNANLRKEFLHPFRVAWLFGKRCCGLLLLVSYKFILVCAEKYCVFDAGRVCWICCTVGKQYPQI